ncbi:MAG: peptidyl-prolyl cis-trans isomerase [Solirubrobacteraceae bacterium]
MFKLLRFSALGAFFVALAVGLAACGGGGDSDSVPADSVAKIGDSAIKKETFDHWMQVAAISSQGGATGATKASVPDAPEFTACIANKTKTAPKPAKGQPKPTADTFKTQCQQEYDGLKQQVLQFLISSEWIQGEAAEQKVEVSQTEVDKQFETTKKQSFPKPADFDKFLKTSGMTLEDIKFRVKLDALSNDLRKKVTDGKDKVSDTEISDYYDKNKTRFAQPERRDLRIVLTKTEAKANEAKSALQGGQSFKDVAKSFSIDQASKNQGGVLLAVAKGQQEKALDEAVFAASKGKLTGPVKTQFGYYIFEVTKITAASQQSLKDATPTIKQLLASQNQQKALDAFVKDFRARWKDKTNCAKDFVTQDCKNAPKPKTTTTGTGSTVPAPTTTTG